MKNIFFMVSCGQLFESQCPPALVYLTLLWSVFRGWGDHVLWEPRGEGSGDPRERSGLLSAYGERGIQQPPSGR